MISCGSKKHNQYLLLSLSLKILTRKTLRKKKMRQQQKPIDWPKWLKKRLKSLLNGRGSKINKNRRG
jgi:hypothetical protein